jgi:hypothetical protein
VPDTVFELTVYPPTGAPELAIDVNAPCAPIGQSIEGIGLWVVVVKKSSAAAADPHVDIGGAVYSDANRGCRLALEVRGATSFADCSDYPDRPQVTAVTVDQGTAPGEVHLRAVGTHLDQVASWH